MLFLVILLFTLISCAHAAEQQIDAPEKYGVKTLNNYANLEQLSFLRPSYAGKNCNMIHR